MPQIPRSYSSAAVWKHTLVIKPNHTVNWVSLFLIETMQVCPVYPQETLMSTYVGAAGSRGAWSHDNMKNDVVVVGGEAVNRPGGWSPAAAGQSSPVSSALWSYIKPQQLTSLRHKTWQKLIRPELWSDNPICEVFFSNRRLTSLVLRWYCAETPHANQSVAPVGCVLSPILYWCLFFFPLHFLFIYVKRLVSA